MRSIYRCELNLVQKAGRWMLANQQSLEFHYRAVLSNIFGKLSGIFSFTVLSFFQRQILVLTVCFVALSITTSRLKHLLQWRELFLLGARVFLSEQRLLTHMKPVVLGMTRSCILSGTVKRSSVVSLLTL